MPTRLLQVLLLLSVASACGNKPADKSVDKPADKPAENSGGKLVASSCKQSVDELGKWISRVAEDGRSWPGHEALLKVDQPSTDWERYFYDDEFSARRAGIISIRPGRAEWDGELLGDPAYRSQWEHRFPNPNGKANELILTISPEAPWEAIANVGAVAESKGYKTLHFVVESTQLAPPPPESSLHDEWFFPRNYVDRKLNWIGPTPFEKTFAYCPQVIKLFEGRSISTGRADLMLIAERLPKAVQECDCSVEFESAKEFIWIFASRKNSANRFASMTSLRLDSAAGTLLEYPQDTTWEDLYLQLRDRPRGRLASKTLNHVQIAAFTARVPAMAVVDLVWADPAARRSQSHPTSWYRAKGGYLKTKFNCR